MDAKYLEWLRTAKTVSLRAELKALVNREPKAYNSMANFEAAGLKIAGPLARASYETLKEKIAAVSAELTRRGAR